MINEYIAYHIYWFNGAMDTENGSQIGIGHRVVATNHQKPLWKKKFPLVQLWELIYCKIVATLQLGPVM